MPVQGWKPLLILSSPLPARSASKGAVRTLRAGKGLRYPPCWVPCFRGPFAAPGALADTWGPRKHATLNAIAPPADAAGRPRPARAYEIHQIPAPTADTNP